MTPFEKMILLQIPADYSWSDSGIVRLGKRQDIAAFAVGDFSDLCLIFCHGNGETAISERYWFEKLSENGISVICPDYRGYGLSSGPLSEHGCYEAAHAAYEWLSKTKKVPASRIAVLGYSLGSAVAVELAVSVQLMSMILQAPFLGGAELRPIWERRRGDSISKECEKSFPTFERLPSIYVPTLVIHGVADSIIPFEHGKIVFKRLASTDKMFIPVEDGGHCNFQFFLGEKYVSTLVDFLRRAEKPRKRLLKLPRIQFLSRLKIALIGSHITFFSPPRHGRNVV